MVRTFLRSIFTSFATNILDVPARLLSLLFFLLLLLVPMMRLSDYLLSMLITAFLMAIFAASWDLLVGRCGLFSFGHGFFFGVGAYTTALLFRYYELPIQLTIPIGILMGVLLALPVGFPSVRLKGPYLALTSMALPLIATGVVFLFRDITGGEHGIYGLPRFFPSLEINKQAYSSPQYVAEYYLALVLLFISATILYKIANSRIGIIFVSILDDEVASKACGINTTKYKLMAFAISALFASLAGTIFAHSLTSGRNVGPAGVLAVSVSFLAITMTIFGGIGTIYGPIAGALIMTLIDQYVLVGPPAGLIEVADVWHPLIFFVLVIILLIKWPRGIARFTTDQLDDLQEERLLEERGKRIWKREKVK